HASAVLHPLRTGTPMSIAATFSDWFEKSPVGEQFRRERDEDVNKQRAEQGKAIAAKEKELATKGAALLSAHEKAVAARQAAEAKLVPLRNAEAEAYQAYFGFSSSIDRDIQAHRRALR